jgi:hypothetical protein
MRNSQYTEGYLAYNRARGIGKGVTIGTYLSKCLRGTAKSWKGRYARSLENSLLRVGATEGKSIMGSVAYY